MAEVVGLAASIIQIAGAGAKLSTALYNFVGSVSRADHEMTDIAGDVELTANALDSVGKVFEDEDAKSVISTKAVQDAKSLIKRCEGVFSEIHEAIDKRRKVGKDGKKSLSALGKFSWPLKEQKVQLLRSRLESLKNSLVLLLHVLQLASSQAKGKLERGVLEKERETIRELHQRQQDSLKCLHALESKFCKVSLDDEETLRGSNPPSRVPTIELMTWSTSAGIPEKEETSDSDDTITGEESDHLTAEDLAKCAKHVQWLLQSISALQQKFESAEPKPRHRKSKVQKMYRRFCKRFETDVLSQTSTNTQSPPPLPASKYPSLPGFGDDTFSHRTLSMNSLSSDIESIHTQTNHTLGIPKPLGPPLGIVTQPQKQLFAPNPSILRSGQEEMPSKVPWPPAPMPEFTSEDDQLLVDLKEKKNLTWLQIADFFPGRSPSPLRARYYFELNKSTKTLSSEGSANDASEDSSYGLEIDIPDAVPEKRPKEVETNEISEAGTSDSRRPLSPPTRGGLPDLMGMAPATMNRTGFHPISYSTPQSNSPASVRSPQYDQHGRPIYGQPTGQTQQQMYYTPFVSTSAQSAYRQLPPTQESIANSLLIYPQQPGHQTRHPLPLPHPHIHRLSGSSSSPVSQPPLSEQTTAVISTGVNKSKSSEFVMGTDEKSIRPNQFAQGGFSSFRAHHMFSEDNPPPSSSPSTIPGRLVRPRTYRPESNHSMQLGNTTPLQGDPSETEVPLVFGSASGDASRRETYSSFTPIPSDPTSADSKARDQEAMLRTSTKATYNTSSLRMHHHRLGGPPKNGDHENNTSSSTTTEDRVHKLQSPQPQYNAPLDSNQAIDNISMIHRHPDKLSGCQAGKINGTVTLAFQPLSGESLEHHRPIHDGSRPEAESVRATAAIPISSYLNVTPQLRPVCDRCKILKIRCDGPPEGCTACVQNGTQCQLTTHVAARKRAHYEDSDKTTPVSAFIPSPWPQLLPELPPGPFGSIDAYGQPAVSQPKVIPDNHPTAISTHAVNSAGDDPHNFDEPARKRRKFPINSDRDSPGFRYPFLQTEEFSSEQSSVHLPEVVEDSDHSPLEGSYDLGSNVESAQYTADPALFFPPFPGFALGKRKGTLTGGSTKSGTSEMNSYENFDSGENGKDIVDLLLEQWTVPGVSTT